MTATPRPIVPEDLLRFELVNDPQLSPDGRRVAYVVTTLDAEADEYRSAIYVAPVEGGAAAAGGETAARRFTAGGKRDTAPRWSPDGRWLAFLSDRDGRAQLYAMPTAGGEPWALTRLPEAVAEPVWSPDSRRLAFVSKVPPPDPEAWAGKPEEERKRLREKRPREIRALKYKLDGEGFRDGKVRHIFVVDLDPDRPSVDPGGTPEPRRLTDGDCDNINPAWSPDGSLIAFISNRTPDREFNDVGDVYVVPAEGGEPRKLTPSRGPGATPAFSPDGRLVAYVGHDNPPTTGPNTNDALWVVPVEGGEPRKLTGELDRVVGSSLITDTNGAGPHLPTWTPDGRAILFLAGDGGNVPLFRVDVASGVVDRLVGGERQLLAFSLARSGERLAYAASDPRDPGQVYVASADGSGERRLTDQNRALLAELQLSGPEVRRFRSSDGQAIEGWLIKPPDFAERTAGGKRIPLILEIHGGPHGAYGNAFFFEFQLLAARGHAVLYTNPRGSTGYGEAFTCALTGDWGGVDYRDVIAAVEAVLAEGWADPERLGVTGGSYGGYLTNWIIGQEPAGGGPRFRAAATGRSTANRYSHYGNSDIGFRTGEWEFGGPPWRADRTAHYLERSPITYVERVRTPLLILHQEQDLRCPIEQAEQLFTALRRLGREVEFVRFPNESHGMSRTGKPSNRLYRLRRLADWFDRHLA